MILCGTPPASGPKLLAKDFLPQFTWCCAGAAMRGARHCTCWEPVYNLVQQRADPNRRVTTRRQQCVDCAYRPDSPEMKSDPYGLLDLDSFWCHQGMRRPIEWRHPDGRVRPGNPGDYQPLIIGEVAYRADGRPAQRCAGWAQQHRADIEAERARTEDERAFDETGVSGSTLETALAIAWTFIADPKIQARWSASR